MLRTLAAMLLALMMAGCSTSRKVTPPPLAIPQPPSDALQPCAIPALLGGSAEAVELALIERGAEIARCEAKRLALVQAWPK